MSERYTIDVSGTGGIQEDEFPALPAGEYKMVIYEIETKETGPNSKSGPGKPYYKLQLRVAEEGDYYKRVVFDNFVALYRHDDPDVNTFFLNKIKALAQIAGKWDGDDSTPLTVPTPEELQGIELTARVKRVVDEYAMERAGSDEKIYTNEVSSYKPLGGWGEVKGGATAAKTTTSIVL